MSCSNLCGLTIFFIAGFSVLYTAESLKCYKCTSYEGELCADYFNQTEIRQRMIRDYQYGMSGDTQMPKENDCGLETLPYPAVNQRAVCVKKIEMEYGRRKYTRQCMFLNRDLTTLECPQEPPNNHRSLESCDVCENDLCNSTPSLYSMSNVVTLTVLLIGVFLIY